MYTLFFTADIQGSEQNWKKTLNGAEIFKADALIVSGNLIGTALLPIIRGAGDTWHAEFDGAPRQVQGDGEVAALEKRIRAVGYYPCRVSPEEALELDHQPILRRQRFEREATLTLQRWLELAEQRLRKTKQRIILLPGVDDPFFVREIIEESRTVEYAQGHIPLSPVHKLICGCAPHAGPPYDADCENEDEFFRLFQDQVSCLTEVHAHVFTFPIPPRDSVLSHAPCLNCARGECRQTQLFSPPCSAAIRRLIETYQPLLSLHAHSRSRENKFTHIGRTLCCAPGNSRHEGLLSAFLITLEKLEILDFQPIQG